MGNRPLYIVTGANGGIGQALTRQLADRGYRVLMACRNMEKSEPILQHIRQQSGNPDLTLMPLDLESRESIDRFAQHLLASGEQIEVLINNAGTMSGTFRLTADGQEQTFGVNYLGTVALTLALLPLMHSGSRIINTLSCTYRIGHVDNRIFMPNPTHYTRFSAYANSKLALLLFTLELKERVKELGIEVFAADPGVVDTGMITMQRWFDPLADLLFRPLIKRPEQGAATALQLATQPLNKQNHTLYWSRKKNRKIPKRILNHSFRKTLWEETLKLTNQRIFKKP